MPGPQDTGGQPYVDLVFNNGVGVNLTQTGVHTANASPVSSTNTTTYTGVAAQTTTTMACTNSTVLQNDGALAVTLNEAGVYALSAELLFYSTSNGAGGIKFDLGGGTANVSSVQWGWIGYGLSLQSGPANNSTVGAQTMPAVANSAAAASWVELEGTLTVKTPGTFSIRWAQATGSANTIYRGANSYLEMMKIG